MARSGTETRERILDAAERLILDKGLAATSVDEILAESKTSKGSFFHHFPSKNHLARALVERYAAVDIAFLNEITAKAEAATDDPALQMVALLKLFEDAADETVSNQSSCLYVSYIFDRQLFVDGTNAIIAGGVGSMSAAMRGMITSAAMSTVCTTIDSGTVYHFCPPTLIDGSTMSPNISRGTARTLLLLYYNWRR